MRTREFREDAEVISILLQAASLVDIEALALMLAELALLTSDTKPTHKLPIHNLAEPHSGLHVLGQHRRRRPRYLARTVPGVTTCNPG